MNYLAHALLSSEDPELLLGNFIADHVRGNQLEGYPAGVVKGIQLHRRIDSFTDEHALFKASKRFFYERFQKYSGILVDIYFDHLLARDFQRYHQESLWSFSQKVYAIYSANQASMPEHSSRFLTYLIRNDLYRRYAEFEGITEVLKHFSMRIGHGILLDDSVLEFKQHEVGLQTNFDLFMADIQQHFQQEKL